jgi:hypothetical protein
MKKILLILFALAFTLFLNAQSTKVFNQSIEIRKVAPVLYLNGTGAIIDFYNNDLRFTQSSNLLTLSGGNMSLGSNSLLMTGSLGSTGAGKLLKGWMTDLEITNLPTINGGTLATALNLSDYLLAADTTYMHTRLDSTINVLKDTIPISTVLDINLNTDSVADLSEVRLRQAYADSRSVMTFGAGGGNAGDTTVFTTSTIYGSPYWGGTKSFHVDTMLVSMVHGLGLDTLDVQISFSDTLKAVVPTKLNTAALPIGRAAGVNKALTVGQVDAAFDNAVIPPGKIVYCTTPYVPAAALKRKPTYLSVTLIGHLQ